MIVIVTDDEVLKVLYERRRKFVVEVATPEDPQWFQVGIKTARQMLRYAEENQWCLEADVTNFLAFLTINKKENGAYAANQNPLSHDAAQGDQWGSHW